MEDFPYIVSREWLAKQLDTRPDDFLLVDVSNPGIYAQAHLPGAIHVNYKRLQREGSDLPGLAPEPANIERLLADIGYTPDKHVIAYDEEGGPRAARFLWLLALAGISNYSYLDGGIHAWLAAELPFDDEPVIPAASDFTLNSFDSAPVIAIDELLACYQSPDYVIWDTRSAAEFSGMAVNSKRPGHIPGAINYDWEKAISREDNNLIRPLDVVQTELEDAGITPDKTVVVHCRTHHRSSFAWLLARQLGYPRVRAYAGSWAEWGDSRDDTPVES